jgi:hypothetical protein
MAEIPHTHGRLYDFFRAEMDAARAGGFDLARRIPDTNVWASLRLHDTGSDAVRELFYDYAARSATSWYGWIAGLPRLEHEASRYEPLFQRLTELRAQPELTSVPLLRMLRGAPATTTYKGAQIELPKALIDRANAVTGAKAPELRKAVKQAFGTLGLSRARNDGGGCWGYRCTHGDTAFLVNIDYGGRYAQLRYDAKIPALGGEHLLDRLIYETTLGLGRGDWNFLTVDNLDESMRVLIDVVRRSVELPARILASVVVRH